MLRRIKAVAVSVLESVKQTAVSVKTKIFNFFTKAWKYSKDFVKKGIALVLSKTKHFIKVNIADNFMFGIHSAKSLFKAIFRGVKAGGVKAACSEVSEETKAIRSANVGAFAKLGILASSIGIVAICIASVLFWNFNTVAVSVKTNGHIVGYISNSAEYDNILSGMNEIFVSGDAKDHISPIELGFTVVSKSEISGSGYELADDVLAAQSNISLAAGLYVEGEYITCATNENVIKQALNLRKNEYKTETTETTEILEKIEIKSVFCLSSEMPQNKAAGAMIANAETLPLSIVTTETVENVRKLEFETVITEDETKVVGYNRIYVQGKDGTAKYTENIVYINGVITEVVELSREIIEAPINQVIVSGTSQKGMSSVQKTLASKGISFLWPIAVTDNMYISSVWGDGRNHGGIDITGNLNTAIYASYDGTVSYAGYMPDYGYIVIINHKGGYQTAYAHLNTIYVKAGQVVSTGDVIAGCGHSGIATGDHVHFEVRIGGTRVNPAPYIGLPY